MSKSHYGAMDLHVARSGGGTPSAAAGSTTSTSSSNASRKADDSSLSARNILIRRKLSERKRFDSADHAMRQQQPQPQPQPQQPSQPQPQPAQQNKLSGGRSTQQGFSAAQVGASVFFNALGGGDENVDMEASAPPAPAPARGAEPPSRYGGLLGSGPAGGAASARSILIQKKLREKKHFDSADYQLAAQLRPHAGDSGGGASAMEIDPTPAAAPATENLNSPSGASAAARSRVDAQLSPSVRGGRYGGLSGASVLVTRKLSEKKRFDSADYQMQAGPAAARAAAGGGGTTSFFVPAAAAGGSPSAAQMPPPPPAAGAASRSAAAPARVAVAASPAGGGSKYGKLSAANVLIRKKLKERKRFDSADYAMEKQGQEEPTRAHQGGSAGALRGGHVVVGTPSAHTPHATDSSDDVATTQDESKAMNHQVKHIKLSGGGGGWAAARVTSAASPGASASGSPVSAAGAAKLGGYGSLSQDSRLAARNLIIQRKLSERKHFDSADYFKEAAAREPSG